MRSLRAVVVALASSLALLGLLLGGPRDATAGVSSLTSSAVTVYGARWCSACKSLEKGLADRKIPFDLVDVDDNPSAFERARAASGQGSAIPLTSIVRTSGTVWIVGADVEAVDRAQRE
ncbi:MAG: glutaredoxin family protein [Labilithrix sp.]